MEEMTESNKRNRERPTVPWTYWQMLTLVSGVILLLTMLWDSSKASAWRWIVGVSLIVGSSVWILLSKKRP